jgi:predicted phage terminase large subunit-like protein
MSIGLLDFVLRDNLPGFIRKTFRTLNPGTPYRQNWHIKAIAWRLEQVRLGQIKRLIITMPPRSLKSISASVAFPAFVHGKDPTTSILCVSYGQDLAAKLQNDYRAVLGAPWYKRIFPGTRIGPSKDSESEVMLTARGTRFATSTAGALTGRGADIIIIDDPLKASDANSDAKRNFVNDWYGQTLASRLNDKETGAIVIVTQRVHLYDLVGYLLERSPDDWTVLNLPAIAPTDERIQIGDNEFHIRKADDVLHAERESREALEGIRRILGAEAFAAQYLQCPIPPGGLLFKREWLQYYDNNMFNDGTGRIAQSWDTASKTGGTNDYSVCTTWLVAYGNFYLLDVIRGKFEYPTLKAKAIQAAARWLPSYVLVEDTGIGTGLIQELKQAGITAIGVQPKLSKKERATLQTLKFAAKKVYFPKEESWLSELEAEVLAFPSGGHDDQVDSIVQMLGYEILPFRVRDYRLDGTLVSET